MKEIIVYTIATAGLAYFCYCLYCWYVATQLHGRFPFGLAVQTTLSMFFSRNWWRHLFTPLTIILGIGALWWQPEFDWFLLVPMAVIGLVSVVDIAKPPSVLFLGCSKWTTIRRIMRLQCGIYPYRVIFLLDAEAAKYLAPIPYWRLGIDNVRTLGTHDWHARVFYFVNRVPLVVLDTTIPSQAVIEEIRYVVEHGLGHKVLFIVNDDGSSPALDLEIKATDRSAFFIVKESEVVETLKKRGCTRTHSPLDSPLAVVIGGRDVASKYKQVGKVVPQFAAALQHAHAAYGETTFVVQANQLLVRFLGPPGSGLEQGLADVDSDHAAAVKFVDQWSTRELVQAEYRTVMFEAIKMCFILTKLQVALDSAPRNILDKARKLRNSRRDELRTVANGGHTVKYHPIVGVIPGVLFLLMVVFTGQLIRDPCVSYLPIPAFIFFIIGLILMWSVRSRMENTRKHHDAETDTREVYFNQNVSVAEKFMLLQQQSGCFTFMAGLSYFLLALVCVTYWVIGKYFVNN